MKKLALALAVGLLLGAAAFFFAPHPRTPDAPAAPPTPEPALVETEPPPAALTEPGLILSVESDGAPVPGARVELAVAFHQRWVPLRAELTDAQGRVELAASAGAYVAVARTDDGRSAVQHFDVARASTPTRVTLLLKAPVALAGQVLDAETKEPLRGALVWAHPLDAELTVGRATADSFGRFSLSAPPAKAWRLFASAPGYPPRSEETEGAPTTLALTRGARLEGTVLDEAGAPVTATVRLAPGDGPPLETDEAGHFTATVPRAPVSLHASTANGLQALARLNALHDVERVTLVVRAGTALRGEVRDALGPAAGVEVRVLAEPDDLDVATLQTNADGKFEAAQLPPGRYSVDARRGGGAHARAVGVEVPTDAPVLLELPAPSRLQGRVDIDGEPAEGALVTLDWARGLHEPRRAARTGADGRFDFEELPAAAVQVNASLGNLNAGQSDLYLAPGGALEVGLTLSNLGRLVGRVISPTPVAFIGVRAEGATGPVRHAVIDGGFDLQLAVGEYTLFIDEDGVAHENQPVEIRGGETTDTLVYADPPWKHPNFMHPTLGSGLSFDNAAGSVRVDFLMEGCPAAKAGVKQGDLVISIDGTPVRDSVDAFARANKPSGETLTLVVRRGGADVPLTVR